MPAEPLLRALNRMRGLILDPDVLVKAVASGRRRGAEPAWRRVEVRYVDLKSGTHLQVVSYDATQAHTANHPAGAAARDAVDALLDEPFGHWNVETTTEHHAVRVTKKLEAMVNTKPRTPADPAGGEGGEGDGVPDRSHDQAKQRLLPEDDPVFRALGISDHEGRIKPSRQAKYRQVEEFLRLLETSVAEAIGKGHLRRPTAEDPLRIVDLGCGNGYLTFAAQRYLTTVKELPVVVTGVDVKQQSREHNSAVATELGMDAVFEVGTIDGVELDREPDVVLALHACDTATDDALARAVRWGAPLVLAAPCCHHDIAAQLRRAPTPAPYSMLTRHGILRERFADTLTDGLRASLMRLQGYRVDVVQFVESQHTPRNTMLRATLTGSPVKGGSVRKEYDELVTTWQLRPKLGVLLGLDPVGD
ncbi:class I SAM-dependent methyltransferase [Nocardioides insulae]|uniref:class I SAM-dependent methyltransferase n=1 Tax=Nocardioides insulae TaxID=394734 RepID=UPI0004076C15|nr:SAM-dependent methyltransferase [Nocardioides insulae]